MLKLYFVLNIEGLPCFGHFLEPREKHWVKSKNHFTWNMELLNGQIPIMVVLR